MKSVLVIVSYLSLAKKFKWILKCLIWETSFLRKIWGNQIFKSKVKKTETENNGNYNNKNNHKNDGIKK